METMPLKCAVRGGGSWFFEECPSWTEGTPKSSVSRNGGNDEITNFIMNWY
jgi:hypothetical protein